jgi:hypothetical protein
VSVLVVAQSSSEIPEGLMNNPVYGQDSLLGILLLEPCISLIYASSGNVPSAF